MATLGFEAPMFVPIRTDPKRLTAARHGEWVSDGVDRFRSMTTLHSVMRPRMQIMILSFIIEQGRVVVGRRVRTRRNISGQKMRRQLFVIKRMREWQY